MSFLCDTNLLAELARAKPHPRALAWAESQTHFTVSAVTVEEVAYGLAWHPNAKLEGWFDKFFATHCTILPVDADVARAAGRLRGTLQSRGQSRTQADMLIAATAGLANLVVVTRNVSDFLGCTVEVFDPWTGRRVKAGR